MFYGFWIYGGCGGCFFVRRVGGVNALQKTAIYQTYPKKRRTNRTRRTSFKINNLQAPFLFLFYEVAPVPLQKPSKLSLGGLRFYLSLFQTSFLRTVADTNGVNVKNVAF